MFFVVAGTFSSALGTRLMAVRRPIAGTVLVAGVGSAMQMTAYGFLGESTVAAMGGLVSMWTVVLSRGRGEPVTRKTWFGVILVLGGSASIVLSAPEMHPPTQLPHLTFCIGAVFLGGLLLLPPRSRISSAIAPGIAAGFTDTLAKASLFAPWPHRLFWSASAFIFAAAQILLLQKALRRHGDRKINPIYMLSLMCSVIVVGSSAYGEFAEVDQTHIVGFALGTLVSACGSSLI